MMGHAYECNQNILVLVQVNPGVTKRVNASLCDTKIDLTLKYFKILLSGGVHTNPTAVTLTYRVTTLIP